MMHKCTLVGIGLGLMLLPGCVMDQKAEDEALGSSQQKIINGDPVSQENIGLVTFGGCSGTLLTPTWMLTAAHCVSPDDDPANIIVNRTSTGAQRTGERIIVHPTLDVALVKVSQAFPLSSGSVSYANPLYTGTTASLVGRELTCYGYGGNSLEGGFGTLRTARIPVTGLDEEQGVYYSMDTDAEGQVIFFGDSGGPCFIDNNGQRQLTGVHSFIWFDGETVFGGADIAAPMFRDWVDQTIFPDATVEIYSSWNTGYCADVLLRAGFSRSISWWGVHLAMHDANITQLWNAQKGLLFIGDDGPVYQVTPTWNAKIPAGTSQRFGYCATKTGEDWLPEITSSSWR